MPPGTQPPFILRYNASSVPILQLSLSSPTWSEAQLYDYGLRTTINTDNRLMSDTTVSKELYRAHEHLGFSLEEIVDLIIFGFKSAFLPQRSKIKMLRQVFGELNELTIEPKTQKLITTAVNAEAS